VPQLMNRSSRIAAAFLALASSSSLAAQEGDAAPVLDRFRSAVGASNLSAIKTLRSVGKMEIPAAGVSAAMTIEQGAPNRMVMTMDIPGMGAMRSGYDGTIAWGVDPMQGPRVLGGKELQDLAVQADLRALVRDAALLTQVRRGADTTIAGEACTLVAFQWKTGRDSRDCYSKSTGLLFASLGKQATPGGDVEVLSRYSDYKPVAGVQIPYTTIVTIMGQEQVIRIEKIEANVPTSDLQALPKEIVPLVKKP
jgi:hypothetical protein